MHLQDSENIYNASPVLKVKVLLAALQKTVLYEELGSRMGSRV